MTKKAFAEIAISILQRGYVTSDKEPDIREVWYAMDIIRSSEINKILQQDSFLGSEWITTFPDVNVLTDTVRNLKYSNLPAGILSTDGNSIQQVSPVQNEKIHIIQDSSGDDFIYSILPAGKLLGKPSFWREGNKIFYKNMTYPKVLIKMMANMVDLPDNFPVPVPDYQYMMDKILQWFSVQQNQIDPAP